MLSPVPTLYTSVLCGVLLTLCNYKMYENIKTFLFLSQISLRMILSSLSYTGAELSLTVPLAEK